MTIDEFKDVLNMLSLYYNCSEDTEGKNWYQLHQDMEVEDFWEFGRQFVNLHRIVSNSMNVFSMLSLLDGMVMGHWRNKCNTEWLMYQGFEVISKSLENPDLLIDQFSNFKLMTVDMERYVEQLDWAVAFIEDDEDLFKLIIRTEPEQPFFDNIDYEIDPEKVVEYSKTHMPLFFEKFGNGFYGN